MLVTCSHWPAFQACYSFPVTFCQRAGTHRSAPALSTASQGSYFKHHGPDAVLYHLRSCCTECRVVAPSSRTVLETAAAPRWVRFWLCATYSRATIILLSFCWSGTLVDPDSQQLVHPGHAKPDLTLLQQ